METLKKQVVMLFVLAALVLLGSSLVAQQGPPDPCYNECLQTYKAEVAGCKGDAGCVAAARASLQACVASCPR